VKQGKHRIAMYSPGVVGLGHLRRQLLIAQTLAKASPDLAILLIAETRQAGAFSIAPGLDCLILPALRKNADGRFAPRYLGVSITDLMALRARTIHAALEAFAPEVFIGDKLPRGALCELDSSLNLLRDRGTRYVLGLRDILDEPDAVTRDWDRTGDVQVMRDFVDAIWVYGDPAVYDAVCEYRLPADLAAKARYVGYLDQRRRLEFADAARDPFPALQLPPGRLALCLLGGGQDGALLAEAFAAAPLPADTNGVIVTGPFMDEAVKHRLRRVAAGVPRLRVVEFVHEPAVLVERADRIVAMAGYNTACEILSFEKPALLVPRIHPRREQWMRAARLQAMSLVDVLQPDALTPAAIGRWLDRDLPQARPAREVVDFKGLDRLPRLLDEVMTVGAEAQFA
jgi:predicted glycosyltransferase